MELLHVSANGADPLTLTLEHLTLDMRAERPDPAEISARRAEIMAARRRKREAANTD